MSQINFWGNFTKRGLVCYVIIMLLLFTCVLRVAVIVKSDYTQVQAEMSSIKIQISNTRGTIYDCNKQPITNTKKKIIACVSPTPRAITTISSILEGIELNSVLETLKSQKPAVCEVNEIIECDGITYTEIYTDSADIPAIHTIGYVNQENVGVSGLQKAYNKYLQNEQPLTVRFASDGKGRPLAGIKPQIENQFSHNKKGIITTLDLQIQKIAQESSKYINKGAVIIADAKNGKLRAVVSQPNFTLTTIEDSLQDPNLPLFNRTLASYNVGSVFKPCVAAAGLENSKNRFTYNCTGSCKIVDRIFNCHNVAGHGVVDILGGISQSCNTFFYNFSFEIGSNNIINMAQNLGFGKSISLCDSIKTSSGNLPTQEKLENAAHLANLSIGQGELTASPISLLPLYCAIANDGYYTLPNLVEATIENGIEIVQKQNSPTYAFSKSNALILKKALSMVIKKGTGINANPKTVTAAGKTATAQTGKYKSGKEIISSWFCGFFPYEEPKYVVIVFCEDNTKQTKSCAEIFAEIADRINLET